MDPLEPINGVSLEKYAELCVLMANTKPEDTDKHAEIATQNGVSKEDFEAAKIGWTARMQDPAHAMEIQKVFLPAYQNAQAASRGGKEPCTIEVYARVKAEMSYRKDSGTDVQKDSGKILQENNFTFAQWSEIENYWAPRIASPDDPRTAQFFNAEDAAKFRELMQKEHDRIFGIER